MRDKKEKAEILADKLNCLLLLVDDFMNNLNEEDAELLKETKKALAEKINFNTSALPVILACGGEYDSTEDEMKLKTLDCLMDLIKARKEYKEKMIEKQEEQNNRKEVLKMFGII